VIEGFLGVHLQEPDLVGKKRGRLWLVEGSAIFQITVPLIDLKSSLNVPTEILRFP